MQRTSWTTILGATLGAGVVSYALFLLAQGAGSPTPPASWLTHAFMAVVSLVVLSRGRHVRRMVAGKVTRMTPLEAARVLTAAKTTALVGALLGGYFAAIVVFIPGLPPAAVRTELFISGVVGLVMAAGMVTIGLLVENWCRIDPPEGDVSGVNSPEAPSAA